MAENRWPSRLEKVGWEGKGKGHRSRGKLQTGRNGKWLIEARE